MNKTPHYPWYKIGQMTDLQQGDFNFKVPILDSSNHYEKLNNLKDDDELDIEIDVKRVDLVIFDSKLRFSKR